MSTLSEYNNNPGNIKPPGGKANFYEGQIGVDENGFAVFANKDFGRKALIQDIRAKQQQGINTPHAFIDRYAPAGKENPEDSRDNYKLSLATGLGLKGTGDPFPPGSEEKIADLITAFEGRSAPAQTQQEPTVTNPFSQPIPGLQNVLNAPSSSLPPGERPEEVISPEAGAGYGALANVGLQLLGTLPPAPKSTAEEKEALQRARGEYGTTTADIESKFQSAEEKANLKYQAALQDAQSKVDIANQKLAVAQARLQQSMEAPMGMPGGMSYEQANAEFQAAQREAAAAQQAYSQAQAAAKAKAPPPAPAAPAAPEIITDPNAPMQPPRTAEAQVFEGTIDPETGTTGRQRQVYSEVTSFQALQRREQEKALREARERGLVPDIGESVRLQFGTPTGTKAGILLRPQTAEPIKQQEALEQQVAEDRAAQERLAQAQEMERLKQEAILAKQRQSQAGKAVSDIERFHQQRVTRARSAGDTAVTRAAEAEATLPIAQQQARSEAQLAIDIANIERTRGLRAAQDALRDAERAYPGFFERNMRKLESLGIASAPTGKLGLGATGRAISGGVLGAYGAMSLNELVNLYNKGDRSQGLVQALMNHPEMAKEAFGALSAGAALTPALGKTTARIKGAGLAGAAATGAADLYRLTQEEERRLRREQELREKVQGARNALTP